MLRVVFYASGTCHSAVVDDRYENRQCMFSIKLEEQLLVHIQQLVTAYVTAGAFRLEAKGKSWFLVGDDKYAMPEEVPELATVFLTLDPWCGLE